MSDHSIGDRERKVTRISDVLEWPVPRDEHAAMKAYERDPIVFQLVRRYADTHDKTVEEVIYGSTGGSVGYPAPPLGLTEMDEFLQAQDRLNERYLVTDTDR